MIVQPRLQAIIYAALRAELHMRAVAERLELGGLTHNALELRQEAADLAKAVRTCTTPETAVAVPKPELPATPWPHARAAPVYVDIADLVALEAASRPVELGR